ncbi:hypothetical protein Deipe_1940 [Deinococcus peraridilitoris DSM 19664]|uniref:Uncharacterized protein n=1 Tax=Deinococcus peraridilitoris (strain DSM 19664 / LMG 22246 / CIP 109416 / KR-200) TaxID=937777 RepID=L0A0M4_DEIPD|nr:hypothetical protein Deipe_1940 [Deinococcus peraridilitoris DSM 19664]
MPRLCSPSLTVDNPVDNPVDKLWITLWITLNFFCLWITGQFVHRLSTGKAELSTILSTSWNTCQTTPNRVIHSFHSSYYYYYYFYN